MYTHLVILLLLTLLLGPATASSPVLDTTLPVAPMPYPDPDDLLAGICGVCYSFDCVHMMTAFTAETFTAETFLDHPEWPGDGLPVFPPSPEPDLFEPEPHPHLPVDHTDTLRLRDATVQHLNDNATTMLRSTIQIHVEGTYTPGDRLAQAERRKTPHRRQAPRRGGFPCPIDGCPKTFDRSCDLNRHQKTHLNRCERPHKCSVCDKGFLYPKDRARHERTHDQSASPQATLYCPVPGCGNVDGFSRRDNLLRHQRNQHPHLITSS